MEIKRSDWFECKVRYEKTQEDGMPKSVTETYVVDGIDCHNILVASHIHSDNLKLFRAYLLDGILAHSVKCVTKVDAIDNVCFSHLLRHTIFLGLFVAHLTLEPIASFNFHCILLN